MKLQILTTAVALLLPVTALATQVPIIDNKDKLDKVISDSLFLTLHRDLCEINSVSNREYKIAKWIQKFLEAHHFEVITQEVPITEALPTISKPRLNVYAYPNPKYYKDKKDALHGNNKKHSHPPSPKVLLTSHIDTVPPFISYSLSYNSTSDPEHTSFNRSSVQINGRGTVDDKACVAAQLAVAMEFLYFPPKDIDFSPTDIALLFEVDEEAGGQGMTHFSASDLYQSTSDNYKAILFGEPTERKLVSGHKGIFMLDVMAHGKAAHSGYPWLGKSAISMILPALSMLDNLDKVPEHEGGLPGSELFGNTTINVGLIEAGVAGNVVAEKAFARIAFRLAGGTVKENKAIVEKWMRVADPEGLVTYNFTQGYSPVDLDTDVPGFETMVVNYGTDVPWLKVRDGVKRYLYGPGSIFVAHGPNEGLTVGELEAGLEGYRRLLAHALKL